MYCSIVYTNAKNRQYEPNFEKKRLQDDGSKYYAIVSIILDVERTPLERKEHLEARHVEVSGKRDLLDLPSKSMRNSLFT